MDFFGVDLDEPRMEPDNGWGSTAQPTPKHLLLALELCQSIAQGAAVVSLLDGCDKSSNFALDGLEVEPISPDLLLALGGGAVNLLPKGSNELTHEFWSHKPLFEACETITG